MRSARILGSDILYHRLSSTLSVKRRFSAACPFASRGLFLVLLIIGVSAAAAQVHTNRSTADARAHLAAARRALQTGNVLEAKAELELALKSDPALEEAHVALGTLEFQQGNESSAPSPWIPATPTPTTTSAWFLWKKDGPRKQSRACAWRSLLTPPGRM